jgi:hypothetical protein
MRGDCAAQPDTDPRSIESRVFFSFPFSPAEIPFSPAERIAS